jgi:hypothetical protein
MTLIETIKQDNQAEFFRVLSLTEVSEKRVIDEIDVEHGGNALHVAMTHYPPPLSI